MSKKNTFDTASFTRNMIQLAAEYDKEVGKKEVKEEPVKVESNGKSLHAFTKEEWQREWEGYSDI